ncbi:hypothetical protein H7I03_08975, partial [Mycobacterium sherrisii]|nr:hypothetical protein [Mycobacterium sherrisii]
MSHHKKSLTAEQIDDMINAGKLPVNTAGANWGVLESLSNSEVTALSSTQNEFQDISGTTADPVSVAIEDFSGVTFKSMLDDFEDASGTLDNGNGQSWQQIAGNIITASDNFQTALEAQEQLNEWVGKTHDAAIANITQSLPDVSSMASGANALGLLIDAFASTVFETRWYLVSNQAGYQDSLNRWPHEADLINQTYNSFAQDVMNTVYAPNITSIASNNPGFPTSSAADMSSLSDPPPPPDDSGSNTPPPPPDDSGSNAPPPPPDDSGSNAPPPPDNSGSNTPPPDNSGANTPPPPVNVAPPPAGATSGGSGGVGTNLAVPPPGQVQGRGVRGRRVILRLDGLGGQCRWGGLLFCRSVVGGA